MAARRIASCVMPLLLLLAAPLRAAPQLAPHVAPAEAAAVVVAAAEGRFLGWPANNGFWSWDGGRELLVGFVDGPWRFRERGHKVDQPQVLRLARSTDGGLRWSVETPPAGLNRSADPRRARPGELRFDSPDLAVRVVGGGRSPGERLGAFHVSFDRGRRWAGPYAFAGLEDDPRLSGLHLTSRTSVLPLGRQTLLVLLSARNPALPKRSGRLDKSFAARSDDGGRSFRFLGWLIPWTDPFRAVMPAGVHLGGGHLVAALRRRDPFGAEEDNWIDLVASGDGGQRWTIRSPVGRAGCCNGNPPALTQLRDGRLAVVWADRSRRQILLRLSGDQGRSWGRERLVRANPHDADLGYPQIGQNHRGELVVVYYLATAERPQSYIEATLLRP